MKIVVVGATGDVGQRVVAQLCDLGHTVVATSRSAPRPARIDPRAEFATASVEDGNRLAPILAGADRIINIAHASTIEPLLPLVPATCERLILIGSTRCYSAVPDRAADQVRHGEALFLSSNFSGSVLHPTMIYGGDREQNISRVFRLVDRWPGWLPLLWPVPDGGKALVQPVHIDDLVSAIVAAATLEAPPPQIIVVAGPRPFPLADMLRTCARARGRRLRILPLPVNALIAVARLLSILSGRSPFTVAELERSREDKSFDVEPLRCRLGVKPRAFADGIRLMETQRSGKIELNCSEHLTGE